VTIITTLLIFNVQKTLQGMTNNVRFTFNVGGTTQRVYKLAWSKANRISDIKYNV
jgi:hypothetical protein